MKKIYIYLQRDGIIHTLAWFAIVATFALIVSSCASTHCNAYGDSNTTSFESKEKA